MADCSTCHVCKGRTEVIGVPSIEYWVVQFSSKTGFAMPVSEMGTLKEFCGDSQCIDG